MGIFYPLPQKGTHGCQKIQKVQKVNTRKKKQDFQKFVSLFCFQISMRRQGVRGRLARFPLLTRRHFEQNFVGSPDGTKQEVPRREP